MNSITKCMRLHTMNHYRLLSFTGSSYSHHHLHQDATHDTSSTLDEIKELVRPMNYDDASVDLNMDDSNGVAMITINHPEKKNAFTGKMMVDFCEAVDKLEGWSDGKGVLVRGEGGTFCSGGDLRFVKQIANREMGLKMSLLMQDTFTRLNQLPMISTSLVQGNALGGGAEAILATDYRIGSNNTAIGFVQARLGVLPGWGGTTRLVRLIGRTNALQLLATTEIMKWKEALYLGLLNTVMPKRTGGISDELHIQQEVDNSLEWLHRHLVADKHSLHLMKRSVLVASTSSLQESLDFERRQFGDVWGSEAQLKALEKGQKHK